MEYLLKSPSRVSLKSKRDDKHQVLLLGTWELLDNVKTTEFSLLSPVPSALSSYAFSHILDKYLELPSDVQ